MEVRNRLREVRLRKGLSISRIAADLGMSRQTIYLIEGDPTYRPSVALMQRLADYFEISLSELLEPERVA